MPEAKADAAQSDVREHGVGLKMVVMDKADEKRSDRCRYAPHAQRTVCETREGDCEVRQSDRVVVHEEISTAHFATLGQVHQGASTVLDVNGGYPRRGLAKLQDGAPRENWLNDTLATPRAVAVDPPGERRDDRQPGDQVPVEAIEGIFSIITQVNEISTTIAAAVEEQSAATQEIARNVEEVAAGTQAVNSEIHHVGDAAGRTKEAATDVLRAADSLGQQAVMVGEQMKSFGRELAKIL